jgi:2-desacetyl-2-hydroxyethyl bacteriochlorophyllide A dehydrogenase
MSGQIRRRLGEIVRFRLTKAIATIQGFRAAPELSTPTNRDELFFDDACRAVVVARPGSAEVQVVDVPQIKPGDVLIEVAFVGVCATDIEVMDGSLDYYKKGIAKYPIVPGHEFSGTVVKTGSNVTTVAIGDSVVSEVILGCGTCSECLGGNAVGCARRREVGVVNQNGAYSRYVAVPGEAVHKVPAHLDLQKAALCEPLAVVVKALNRLERSWGLEEKKVCAVIGAGPLGHLCALVLKLRGHEVTVFDRDESRLKLLDPAEMQTAQKLDDLTRFDAIVEATGDENALVAAFERSGAGSVLLLVGLPYARREINFADIVSYDRFVVGSVGSSSEDFERALEYLSMLALDPFLKRVVALEDFRTAWKDVRDRRYLKVMIRPAGIDAS